MTNSIFASLKETFSSSNFTLTASSGGSTTTSSNLYYWVNGFSRGGMNLLTSMGQVAVNAGQKLVWTITAKPAGDDIFGWILSASTTNDQTTAKILAVADARDINQETIFSLPITVELTHDSHFGLGVTGALPTSNKLNGMIRYASGHYQQYVAQLDEWQIVNGWNAYIASTITPLSTGVYKNGCDVPILSNESIIDLPDYEGGTSTRFRLSLLNGLTEGSGNLLPVGSKIVLNVLLDNNDAIAADYLNGKIQISPVHKKRRLDGSITALSPGTVTWEWGKPFYTLTSNLERGYSLEFDVTVVNATLPQGATLTFYLSDYGRISERMPSNGAGSMVWASGDRARLYPMQSGVLRGTGSGVIEVTGETYSYPFNCPIRESYAFGLQSNTANQLAAISGLTNGEINFRANENALLATEKVRAVVSTQAVTLTPSDWVSIGSVSANQLINVTVNYPCDANGIGTIRANYPDIIAGSAIGEFNVDKLRVFLRKNGTTITETIPVTVVPGESQTFTITAIGSSTTLPTPTAANLGFYDYGAITTTLSGNSSDLTSGTYEICIAYQYEGEKVVAISHSTSDGAIGENTLTNDQVFGSQAYFNVDQIRNISDPYDGQPAACLTTKIVYVYFSSATDDDDGIDVLQPNVGTGRWLNIARNALHIAETDPTVNDDEGDGYSVGYKWVNDVDNKEFTLFDNSLGAAVWKQSVHVEDLADVAISNDYSDLDNLPSLGTAAEKDLGVADGVCPLDETGKVSSTYLPSYVDDVLEYANFASLPVTGETGKIYVVLDTNISYRWSGSIYVEIAGTPEDPLPDQTGNTGKYLSTNGTVASWEDIPQSGHTIENEGTPLSQRTKLNFIGSAVNVTDNSGDDATEVTINLPETGAGLNLGDWDDSGTFTTGVNFDGNDAKLLIPGITTATRTAATPIEKEVLFDSDLNEVYYGDGTTQGGIKLAKATDISNGLTLDLINEPTTPDTGKLIIYASALDGLIYKKDDQGVVTEIGTGGSGGGREVLTSDRTYFVRTDGNDSNNGTPSLPWLTIPYALDFISKNLDFNGYKVTINLNGTFNITNPIQCPDWVGAGDLIVDGLSNTQTTINYLNQDNLDFSVDKMFCIFASKNSNPPLFQNMKLTNSRSTSTQSGHKGLIGANYNGSVRIKNIDFGATLNSEYGGHIFSDLGGTVIFESGTDYKISGGGNGGSYSFCRCRVGGNIYFNFPIIFTHTNNTTFDTFLNVYGGKLQAWIYPTLGVNFGGNGFTTTAKKYQIEGNGTWIHFNPPGSLASSSLIPGSSPGTLSNGGIDG